MPKHVAIIGGGPAGIEAARAAAVSGARVTLVHDGAPGGRAGWDSLLPSKAWLAAVDAPEQRTQIDPAVILERVGALAAEWSDQQIGSLDRLGVVRVAGVAAFESPSTVAVRDGVGTTVATLAADDRRSTRRTRPSASWRFSWRARRPRRRRSLRGREALIEGAACAITSTSWRRSTIG